MRNRRFAFGAIVLALALAACQPSASGSPEESATGEPSMAEESAAASAATGFDACGTQDAGTSWMIGGVTDVGDLEDKSFNEAGWCGTLAGNAAVGGTAEVIVTESTEDYAANIDTLISSGFNIIVTFGFALGDATLDAAIANPDVQFIGLDQFYCIDADGNRDTTPEGAPDCDGNGDFATLVPNAQGLVFAEAQPGYLAGVLACSISESGVIGAVGGIFAIPPVPQYIGGYHNGCLSVNPDATVLVEYVSEDISVAFNDPDTGRQLADQMVEAGADVLFQVAGGSGQGVLSAACDNDLYAIGVDVDQFNSSPDHQGCLVTSAEKKIVHAIQSAIERVDAGDNVGGNITGDATNDGIGLAPFHNFEDLITDDIQAAIDAAYAGLADGSIDPCAGAGVCFFDPD
ncbi:MAG TPA: BMP family ABC transporter substrate-binding protein [Candidatus Limnocylindria bacterium]|jgi:basic membrane protein A